MRSRLLVLISFLASIAIGQDFPTELAISSKIEQIKKDTSLNLVPNFSFEKYTECPEGCSIIPKSYFVDDWIMATLGTPDYFNSCSNKSGVPNNWVGKLYAKSGKGYAGLIAGMYINGNGNLEEKREYIETPLKHKLLKDSIYYLGFSASLAGNSPNAVNGLGMFLSDTIVDILNSIEHLPFKPQLLNKENKIISIKYKWTEISGLYNAKGNEKFLIIGNFQSDGETAIKSTSNGGSLNCSYYVIDDVYVLPLNEITLSQTILSSATKDNISEATIINFEFDSYSIKDSYKINLDKIISSIKSNNTSTIEISGFTDNFGSENYNLELSKKRANSVLEYIKKAIPSGTKIILKGFGSLNPVVDNNSEGGRKKNRRVEIKLH